MKKEREVDRIIAFLDDLVRERDKYKKALFDLKQWAKQEEHTWSLGKEMDCFVATHYHIMAEKIDEILNT